MAIFWMHKEKKISGASVHLEEIILPPGNLKTSGWENKFCAAIKSSFEDIKKKLRSRIDSVGTTYLIMDKYDPR